MLKRITKSILTRWYLLILLLPLGICGYYSGFFFFTGILTCFPPPGIFVDGIAGAKVVTWNDLNENGIRDKGEPPLPGVKISFDSSTDENGEGLYGDFRPGCSCECWKGSVILITVPSGYTPTTPTRVDLTGPDETIYFGFHQQDPNGK